MTARDMLCELVSDLETSGTDWAEHLAWSNVAKVAPAETGNPGSRLWKPQAEACRQLLELELQLLAPDLVLAFAGWHNWVR